MPRLYETVAYGGPSRTYEPDLPRSPPRIARVHLVLSLLAAAVVSATPPGCARNLPRAPAGLPVPVVVTTSCAAFTISPGGSLSAAPLPPLPTARVPAGGHATLVERGRIVW